MYMEPCFKATARQHIEIKKNIYIFIYIFM
jgi:hypothetical protein